MLSEMLSTAELTYNAKLYGVEEVQQPRGAEPVAEAVRTVKFKKQTRKSNGQKSPRVEIAISLSTVTIQDRKNKIVIYRFPMDCISYCANDHSERKLFSFIARDKSTGKHSCYVFGCEQNQADEILQKLGQAFDTNYRMHLATKNKQSEFQNQLASLQQRITSLEQDNACLRSRVVELELDAQRCTCKKEKTAVASAGSGPSQLTTISAASSADRRLMNLTNPAGYDNTGVTGATAIQQSLSVDVFGMVSFQPLTGSIGGSGAQGTMISNPWPEDLTQASGFAELAERR